jgi:ribulose-5-phosphate 4-epimerase/fuculose-1-phosphate aldolase
MKMMNKQSFLKQFGGSLQQFVSMSKSAGQRSDYVQGGGGNTSCKLDNQWMAIKASGFRLNDLGMDQAYAILDYSALRHFYEKTDQGQLADVEKEGKEQAGAAVRLVDGIPALRPSVEAGFHALLGPYVLHTHSVYANLAACSQDGRDVADKVLSDLDEAHAFVPYINPGVELTFLIQSILEQSRQEGKKDPTILIMQNHGLVITGETAEDCLTLHDQVNQRLARAYGVSDRDWPEIRLKAIKTNEEKTELWQSDTPWLREKLTSTNWTLDDFMVQALYPDQLVYLAGQLDVINQGSFASFWKDRDGSSVPEYPCTFFRETGEVIYCCSENKAKTMEETLCAIIFIRQTLKASGHALNLMSEENRRFINNWESEKYRKTVTNR